MFQILTLPSITVDCCNVSENRAEPALLTAGVFPMSLTDEDRKGRNLIMWVQDSEVNIVPKAFAIRMMVFSGLPGNGCWNSWIRPHGPMTVPYLANQLFRRI